jgi:MFS family permease
MNTFIIFRFVYGVGIGIVLPLSATYMSECTPS